MQPVRSQRVAVLRIIALAALPLVALSILAILQRYQAHERQAARAQLGLASGAALATESYLAGSMTTLRSIVLSDEVAAASRHAVANPRKKCPCELCIALPLSV